MGEGSGYSLFSGGDGGTWTEGRGGDGCGEGCMGENKGRRRKRGGAGNRTFRDLDETMKIDEEGKVVGGGGGAEKVEETGLTGIRWRGFGERIIRGSHPHCGGGKASVRMHRGTGLS